MKKSKFKLLLLFIGLVAITGTTLSSCNDDDDQSQKEQISITDITTNIPCLLTSNDTVKIINSNEELQALCSNAPTLDFSNHSLLIVSGGTTNGVSGINSNLEKLINSNYILSMDIQLNDATVAEGWRKCYLTSEKINSNTIISLQVNSHQK